MALGYPLSSHLRIPLTLFFLKFQTREQKGGSGVPQAVNLRKPVEVQEVTPLVPYDGVICSPGHVTPLIRELF